MQRAIGITGGIACGKSLISTYLQNRGFTVLDADAGAKNIVVPGTQAALEIRTNFGAEYFLPTGEINRAKLANLIFNDERKRLLLNAIIHPKVFAWLTSEKERAYRANKDLVFMDIPLLYESNCLFLVDEVIVVYVLPEIQLQRLVRRDKLTDEEAIKRVMAQFSLEKKVQLANYVIENNGTKEQTYLQIDSLLHQLKIGNS